MRLISHPETKVRRKLVVLVGFQTYLVIMMTGFMLIGTGAVMGEYYYQFGRSMASNLMDPGLFFLFLRTNALLSVKLVFFIVLVVGTSVIISNRIAGPIYRLSKGMDFVKIGDLRHRILLRRGDRLTELAELYNQMTDFLHARLSEDRAKAQEVARELEALEKNGLSPSTALTIGPIREKVLELTKGFEL